MSTEPISPVLQTIELVKNFGALRCTDHVNLQVYPGEIHALIGPNGAGKTTLVAQISGQLPSDQGQIWFAGQDITHVASHARVDLGLVRSFQITRLFKSFTVLDNLTLSVQSTQSQRTSIWRPFDKDHHIHDAAQQFLHHVGLQDRSHHLASELSHGEQRVLELALAMATQPRLLLLDEPMAGTGPQESERIVDLIASLRQQGMAIFLVEHDMDAVFKLADRISVLVNGAIIASAAPDVIRQDAQVRAAYLGDEVPS